MTTAPPKPPILAFSVSLLLACGRAGAAEELCAPVVSPLEPLESATSPAGTVDPNDIDIRADSAVLGRDGDAQLKGNVRVRMGDRQIEADNVEIDGATGGLRVDGEVEYRDSRVRIRGETGSYDAVRGARFGGAEFEVPLRPARGAAEEIAVQPDGRITLKEVEYTTCPMGNSDWTLSASDISLDTQTRNGSGSNVRLDFKGVPILYTPFISFPLGSERKSGFLFPDFSYSQRSGIELSVPYYLNLAPDYDLTLMPRLYSDRGVNMESEFRYLGRRHRGELSGRYLPGDDLRDRDRSLVHWQHRGDFARHWRLDVNAANASDDNYFEDFGLGPDGTSVIYVERNAELRYYDDHWLLLGQFQNFQTIDETIPELFRPYSRVPRFIAQGSREKGLLGLDYRIDSELVNFIRDDGLTGARFDVQPELRLPLRGAGVYVEPAAAYRYTTYELDDVPLGQSLSPSRAAPVMSVDSGMLFERTAGKRSQRLQTLEPRILYLYVPFRDQADLPVFDTGLPDLNLVQLFRRNRYVGADRLSDANQLSYGVTSRILDAESGEQYLSATLGQTVYFDSPRVTLPDEIASSRETSNVVAQLALTAYRNWNVNVGYEWDPEESRGNKSELGVQYRPRPDSVVNLGYRYRRDLIEQVDASTAWPVARRWNIYAGAVYSLREESLIEQFAGFEYASCCWRLRLVQRRYVSSRTGERDSSIALQLELNGLSSVGVPADAFLESSIRGYSRDPTAQPQPRF